MNFIIKAIAERITACKTIIKRMSQTALIHRRLHTNGGIKFFCEKSIERHFLFEMPNIRLVIT